MPKIYQGRVVDDEEQPSNSSSSFSLSSSSSTSPSFWSRICPTPPSSSTSASSTFMYYLTYGIPAYGRNVPILLLVAISLLLAFTIGAEYGWIFGFVMIILLSLGYSPKDDSSSFSSNSSNNSNAPSSQRVRTVRDYPPPPRS